ncbi:MAG: hypothetical protein BGP24_18935 [Lysobacterales bacterium 69-70]|nr:hypothetical protein [Xanthomonadaceae bacterium]ODU31533.1 MAG: hypothetical protein ABS97_19600 [Xanthomonadaceae bacterium SCN 69-320]ODV16669.1 MAG: hypothetical protein ABT27_19315 [Xanthomonadaceae bacterium SCN 69-25]OJY96865.1 MAG: hypothetical protein BGP24_18935 [Xanthomonadales bacterium 69-70]
MKKFHSTVFALALALAGGLGAGFSTASVADPGCIGGCMSARYECKAMCPGLNGVCAAACDAGYQACKAACG